MFRFIKLAQRRTQKNSRRSNMSIKQHFSLAYSFSFFIAFFTGVFLLHYTIPKKVCKKSLNRKTVKTGCVLGLA